MDYVVSSSSIREDKQKMQNSAPQFDSETSRRTCEICKELLTNPQNQRLYLRIVTCDEKWIYPRNPNKSNQWLSPGQAAQPVVRCKSVETMVMLCVWWNQGVVLQFELIPEGRAMNSELYRQKLDRMYTVLKENTPHQSTEIVCFPAR